jgi:hypothetical protein
MITVIAFISALTLALQDTIPPVQPDTLPQPAVNDTIPPPESDGPEMEPVEPEEEVIDTVIVWQYEMPGTFSEAETDSSLRWINMVSLFERYYRERGAITYRMGTTGRIDGLDLYGYETRHMEAQVEGMRINDPLTGAVNWNRIPNRKIASYKSADFGPTYRTETRLTDYYLTQPRTYINFDESKFNYRNLDFVFIQNVRKGTNIELSFWDRRDGGGYPRSGVEGRQAAAKIYHQLSDHWMLKGMYLNNALDREESFGYVMQNPELFAFNRFTAIPNESSAGSNQTSSDVYLQLHRRSSTEQSVSTMMGLHYQTDKWSLEYSADSVAVDFNKAEIFINQSVNAGIADLNLDGRAFWLNESLGNLAESNWLGARVVSDLYSRLGSFAELNGYASLEIWDDQRVSSEAGGKVTLFPESRFSVSAFGGVSDKAPDLQALYWQSNEFSGNAGLLNEQEQTAGMSAELKLTDYLTVGGRGDIRLNNRSVYLDSDNRFVNIEAYRNLSATTWLGIDSRMFEGEVSAIFKTYETESLHEVNRQLAEAGDRIWLKGHLYWKNYMFDRATYVTAGVSGVVSPQRFHTAEFIAPLNRWQHGTNQMVNPSYYRMDIDVSARIRWFMLLLKWENVLDRVNQLGYFESTGYPMPEQRFRLGLRIVFTN